MFARGTPTRDCTLRSMRSSRAWVSTEIVTSSGIRSPSISCRTKLKSVSLAEGNPTSISLYPIRTSRSNIAILRAGDIGSISAWFPSRRSVDSHRGAWVIVAVGQVRSGRSIGGDARYRWNGIGLGFCWFVVMGLSLSSVSWSGGVTELRSEGVRVSEPRCGNEGGGRGSSRCPHHRPSRRGSVRASTCRTVRTRRPVVFNGPVRIERVDPRDLDLATADAIADIVTASDAAAQLPFTPNVGAACLLSRQLQTDSRPVDALLLAYEDDRLVGEASVELPWRDNTDLAAVRGHVHPDVRRRGTGSAL